MPDEDRPDEQHTSPRRRRLLLLVPLAALIGLVGLVGAVWAMTEVPLPGELQNPQASVIQWSDGSELTRVGVENRVSVPLEQVSEAARFAVLAAEDRGFYSQPGISVKGIARALWVNLRSGEIEQGGSTITQQYVRNAFLSQEQTWTRKVRETVLALKLDLAYDKDEILENYLNTVYFGRGAYGIEAAAQTWFGVPADELTASQGAVLAALLRSPSGYDPGSHPEKARDRWTYVLEGMVEQGWLQGPVAAQRYPDVRPPDRSNSLGGPDGYLVRHVEQELAARGISEAELNRGGLVVTTTLDRAAQAAAVAAVQDISGERVPDGVYRALVSVEPGTGRILAEYGGRDYVARQLNSVTQGTAQAGSSFKPYVLAAALRDGISLRTRYDGSSPQTFGDGYTVRNYGGADHGRIDVLEATVNSVNTVYVPLGLDAGLDDVAESAADLGITADMSTERAGASLSLGVTAVRPLDQAVAYATLAARGVRAEPFVVERVVDDDGILVYEATPSTERVLAEDVADDVGFALQQVVERGTGTAADLTERPAAGKTGTTTDNTAAWFVGYTPRLATAVAMYSEREDVPLRGIAGVDEVTGGTLPARIWGRYTAAALQGAPVGELPPPAFVGTAPGTADDGQADERTEPDPDRVTPAPAPQRPEEFPEPPAPSPVPDRPASPEPEPEPSSSSSEEPSEEPTSDPVLDPPLLEPDDDGAPSPEPSASASSDPEPSDPEPSDPEPSEEATASPSAVSA